MKNQSFQPAFGIWKPAAIFIDQISKSEVGIGRLVNFGE